jgi:hypothetical protein
LRARAFNLIQIKNPVSKSRAGRNRRRRHTVVF